MHAHMSTQVLVSKHANEQCVSNALTCTRCYSSNFSLGLIISKINNNFILQFYSLTIAFCFVYISAASLTPGYPLAGHPVSPSDAHTPLSSGLKCSVSTLFTRGRTSTSADNFKLPRLTATSRWEGT